MVWLVLDTVDVRPARVAAQACRPTATGSTRPPPTCAIAHQPRAGRAAVRRRCATGSSRWRAARDPDLAETRPARARRRTRRLSPAEIDRILTRIEDVP